MVESVHLSISMIKNVRDIGPYRCSSEIQQFTDARFKSMEVNVNRMYFYEV